jgi:O-acetyl-ADP-ribose deacetylase (regulator of RNase III)
MWLSSARECRKEAGIPLAAEICLDIRHRLARVYGDGDEWVLRRLNWEDPSRRYGSCLENYGPPEDRVNYFRSLLKGHRPSFAHHALTLLMAHDKLHRNALTTNFDKLIEQSFIAQNVRECQPIRMHEEGEFWGPETDKCYLLKLHGDYDTHNILNTRDETREIPKFFVELARELLRSRGLVALGSAGNEESICKFFEAMLNSPEKRFLSRGIRWGVYVGTRKPDNLSDAESASLVASALEAGSLNRRLVEILGALSGPERPCYLFPVWGSGRFLMRLISQLNEPALEYTARLYLDHDMRISSLFASNGIPPEVADRHLLRLRQAQARLAERPAGAGVPMRKITDLTAHDDQVHIEIVYGDIASSDLLTAGNMTVGSRRAVVSADDTMISAGGGVALALLSAAGTQILLNEIGKLAPIPRGTIAVTSAGSLPVPYIFHAAALEIDERGDYLVTTESVQAVVREVLIKAAELGVTAVIMPLIGAGVAGLTPAESLEAILHGTAPAANLGKNFHLTIVIFDELIISRDNVIDTAERWQHGC